MMTFLSTVLADTTVSLQPTNANVPTWEVADLVRWAMIAILAVAGLIFFFMLIIGGLRWILSGGDKGSTEQARGQITAALIGLIIVFSAWAIARLISAIFQINVLELNFGTVGS